MSNIKKELDIKLFKNLGGIDQFSKSINFTSQNRSVHVPVSTRGIGLLVNQTILRTSQVLPSVEPPIPALYRTSLAQFEAKLTVANASQHQMAYREANVPTRLATDLLNAIVSRPRQLSSVAAVINQVGNVTVNETTFYPRMSTEPHFNNILSTLRNYVVRMSDLATPLVERQTGFTYNSIPGAIWDYDPDQLDPNVPDPATLSLRNPDAVIPNGYDIMNLLDDFRQIDVYFERLGRKMIKSIDDVEFSDRGGASQLVSTVIRTMHPVRLRGHGESAPAEGDADEWYTQRCLTTQDCLMGIIGLLGEVRVEVPAGFIPPYASFRTPYGAAQAFDQSWMTTVESML